MELNLENLLSEMTNDEFRDAQEADRLESHPERDMIKKIQSLIRNEKNKSIDPNSAAVDKDGNIKDKTAGEFAEVLGVKSDDGTEDNVDNIDKVASPAAKGRGYNAAIGSERSEDDKEQTDVTQTTKPMYTENMKLQDLSDKLGISVEDLMDKIDAFKSKEKDGIEANAKASLAENIYVDGDEVKMHLKQYRDGNIDGDDLAQAFEEIVFGKIAPPSERGFNTRYGMEEDNDPSGAYLEGDPDEKVMGENGDVKDYSEELSEGAYKDFLIQAREAYSQAEVEAYMDSLNNDMRLNGSDQYSDFDVEDYLEDFKNYIDDKQLQEHFKRFI